MPEEEKDSAQGLLGVLKAIPPAKQISFLVVLCAVVGGFVALFLWANRPDYQVLFSNLETSDAGLIIDKLKEKKIPYQLKDGGHAILVPDENVYDLRLELAGEGIPRGRSVGFEIFDNMSFGTTEFVQKLKYQQALQGELARTITRFSAVLDARVHLVTAKDSLFVEPEKHASASVLLRLQPGRRLTQRQLQGIVNLVACAVEGLSPENITVVDMEGGLLSGGHGNDEPAGLSATQFEYKRKLEQSLENRVRSMLEPVVGSNKVVARVSADVDFRQVTVSEEIFDPDSVVIRSEQRRKESSVGGRGLPSGSPDLKFDMFETQGGRTFATTKRVNKENAVINYEVNRTNRQVVSSVGDVKRLSAAVIIDGPYEITKDEQGNEVRKFSPRSRREMKNFEDIVKKAIGFDEARGDQVTVSNIPFALHKEVALSGSESASPGWMTYAKKAGKPLFNVVLVALFFFFALKPFRNWLNQTRQYFAPKALPAGAGVPELEAPPREGGGAILDKEQILDLTNADPEKIVEVIRGWMREEG